MTGARCGSPARAVELYSQSQADAYVASHDLGPDGDAVDGNADDRAYDDERYADEVDEDDGYDDGDGATEPGENIPYYDEGRGYRVRMRGRHVLAVGRDPRRVLFSRRRPVRRSG